MLAILTLRFETFAEIIVVSMDYPCWKAKMFSRGQRQFVEYFKNVQIHKLSLIFWTLFRSRVQVTIFLCEFNEFTSWTSRPSVTSLINKICDHLKWKRSSVADAFVFWWHWSFEWSKSSLDRHQQEHLQIRFRVLIIIYNDSSAPNPIPPNIY